MFCDKDWNYEFVQSNFTKVFVNGKLKKHKEKISFDIEKAMLPETQKQLEVMLYNKRIDNLIRTHKETINNLKIEIYRLERSKRHFNYNKEEKEESKEQFHYPCPKENCRGFLNNHWKCGLCCLKLCKDCREVLKETDENIGGERKYQEHKCDPNTVENIKVLQQESKPCPKCATSISKVSGCDQMWCPMCHTAFSWKTGSIEKGHIHNPHYWDYMAKRGEDLDMVRRMEGIGNNRDRDCITLYDISQTVIMMRSDVMRELIRLFLHFPDYELINFRNPRLDDRNRDLRLKYLQNEINEDKFLKMLSMRDKKFKFNDEMTQILNAFYDMSKDLIVEFYLEYLDNKRILVNKKMDDLVREILNVVEYIHNSVSKLCSRFDYSFPNRFDAFLRGVKKTCLKHKKIDDDEKDDVPLSMDMLGRRR